MWRSSSSSPPSFLGSIFPAYYQFTGDFLVVFRWKP